MMEPLSALSLGANILQVLDFAGKVVRTASKLSQSSNGTLIENDEIEITAADLVRSIDLMSTASTSEGDETLKSICDSSCELANELLALLGTAKVGGGSSKLQIIWKTVRTLRMENDVNRIQDRIARLQLQIITNIIIKLK
jgi:hypothetical protein